MQTGTNKKTSIHYDFNMEVPRGVKTREHFLSLFKNDFNRVR